MGSFIAFTNAYYILEEDGFGGGTIFFLLFEGKDIIGSDHKPPPELISFYYRHVFKILDSF
jgi:hypothetical protein